MRHPRQSRRARGRRARLSGISGAAALISAAALVVSALPADAATVPTPLPPSPGEVVQGQRTDTPALVQGIREQAPAAATPENAARTYLNAKQDRYRITNAPRDLTPAGTTVTDGHETVRLQQKHHGIPVLGGEYIVRMQNKDGTRTVTGTSGKYFTALHTDTTAEVTETLAVERAVEAVLAELNRQNWTSSRGGTEEDTPPLKGIARGLVVLPRGPGVLTHHITVHGTDPASGEPVVREIYIDAHAGYPVFQYSGIQTFGTPVTSAGKSRTAAGKPAASSVRQRTPVAEQGTGVKLDGTSVALEVEQDASSGLYVLRDRTRIPADEYTTKVLSTWDARGKLVGDVSGGWPDGIKEFGSPTPAFGAEATDAGAVDAHWAAGQVYDYFRDEHGRNSLDGHGTSINSLVGVTGYSGTYVNAFWDGQKMVYGIGDEEYRPLSAAVDVAGHEMTHGVIERSARLVYAGQSGAMNEAIADYFGNTIEAKVHGTSATDPDSGLVGERLCRTKAPRECALRDLNDGRTTTRSFIGFDFINDNGGVHQNSTIFGGALWDAREDLGPDLTDRIVYKALTEYLTPLDGFTEGRAAVLAAAKDLGVKSADQKTLQRAFTAHGIVPGWELAIGSDSDVLLGRINTTGTGPDAGGGWWAVSKSNEDGSEPYSVWAGRTDGKGQPKLISPNDGRYHDNPATDGKTVVWTAHGVDGVDLLARPLAGGPVKILWHGRSASGPVSVDGDVVAFDHANIGGRAAVSYLSLKDPQNIHNFGGGTYQRSHSSSANHGKVAYQSRNRVRGVTYALTTNVIDVATGVKTVVQQAPDETTLGPTAINGTRVFWLLEDWSGENDTIVLRSAALDGSGVVDLTPATGPDALYGRSVTASETAVTVGAYVPDDEIRNESLPKLYQFDANGSVDEPGTSKGRVSCNRGTQTWGAAVDGSQVVWLDSTTGTTNLVTRTRPTGRCD
ncbi:M4 family metallopeptidase [Streptomyces sp. AM 4-1-1]|uniref:M4 family metallopeptidase n=1 Tax=Streptomyces sp. AM 4-1-1 TaxID=3028710 RepID=UPI0023B8DBDE|nr:M4 family metallopeptidase [Streptomyces sp. AM 4-1-1]WEH36486.1 M4 family metallopeptidase [Streptomyces sp. AM 4-1-1]